MRCKKILPTKRRCKNPSVQKSTFELCRIHQYPKIFVGNQSKPIEDLGVEFECIRFREKTDIQPPRRPVVFNLQNLFNVFSIFEVMLSF